ncbi:MAG: hypothetical protein WBV73_31330 [Phormidium sp.]
MLILPYSYVLCMTITIDFSPISLSILDKWEIKPIAHNYQTFN